VSSRRSRQLNSRTELRSTLNPSGLDLSGWAPHIQAQIRKQLGEQPLCAPVTGGVAQGARARHVDGVPNETEIEYAELHLEPRKLAGEIVFYLFEPYRFVLAKLCTYKIDYIALLADGTWEAHEVKGERIEDDAAVKMRVFPDKYPNVTFILARKLKTGWKIERRN